MSNQIEMCKVSQYVAIDKLKRHPENPRHIRPERLEELKNSIIKKGFYQPILVWKKGGIVLSGNHRLLAAKELLNDGYEFISPDGKKNVLPVVIENVDGDRAKAILFESNNTYAEWVEDKLRSALKEAEDISDYGFTQDYVDKMLASAIEEAEDVLKGKDSQYRGVEDERKAPPEGLAPIDEEFESLILPKSSYEELKSLLSDISEAISPTWKDGDSFADAVSALVVAAREMNLVSMITGEEPIEVEAEEPEPLPKKKKK